MLPNLTTDVFSRYNRQTQVEDNSCGSGGAEGLQCRLAITRDLNGISLGLKKVFQCLLSALIILDDQNRFHNHRPLGKPSSNFEPLRFADPARHQFAPTSS